MNLLIASIHYAARQFRVSRVFTAAVVLTLALGIGGTTAIFTLIDAVMLRSLPVSDPAHLYRIGDGDDTTAEGRHGRWGIFAFPLYERLKAATPELEDITAFDWGGTPLSVRRQGRADAARPRRAEYATGTYFSTLGVGAFAGRVFAADDDRPSAPPVVVLSHHAWQEAYGADPSVVGSTFVVEGHPFTVIGVTPSGFFDATVRSDPPDIWIPLQQEPMIAGGGSLLHQSISPWLFVIGRLRRDASIAGMAPRLTEILRQWIQYDAGYPSNWMPDIRRDLPKQTVAVVPAGAGIGLAGLSVKEQYGPSLQILLAICGLVLLIWRVVLEPLRPHRRRRLARRVRVLRRHHPGGPCCRDFADERDAHRVEEVTFMRLASFNLENLFDRAKAFNQDTIADGKKVLDKFGRLNKVFARPTYNAADKKTMLDGLDDLGVLKDDNAGEFVRLRQNRGKLLKRPHGEPVEVVANGRDDWIGWLELKTERVNEIATQNTARVIRDVKADVLATIEVDNRVAVLRFNEQLLPSVNAEPYPHVMVIDGNDDRGIDVGLMTRFPLGTMRSHVDDLRNGSRIFSRDCPEYEILLQSGGTLLLLVNHFKSKGSGTQADSNARRLRQAERVREIYEGHRQAGVTSIAVIGDFNDTPDSAPLAPLLAHGSNLRDVSVHPKYQDDGRPGTFANGTKSQKIDYILLSPELFDKVENAEVFRKGVWGGKNGDLFEHFLEMRKPADAASDHAVLFVDLNI